MPIVSVASGGGVGDTDLLIQGDGLVSATYDRIIAVATLQPVSGAMRATAIAFTAGQRVTNLTVLQTQPGTGVTHGWLLLYNSALALVAQTADTTAIFNAGTAICTIALTGVFTIPSSGTYFAAVLVTTATTMPTFACSNMTNTTEAAIGTGARRLFQQTGLATPPNPAVPASAGAGVWVGAS